MKDNISLIAAAAGGFMLSVALAGILRGAPITTWQEQSSFHASVISDLRVTTPTQKTNKLEFFEPEAQKS